jgi:hypothetical protein
VLSKDKMYSKLLLRRERMQVPRSQTQFVQGVGMERAVSPDSPTVEVAKLTDAELDFHQNNGKKLDHENNG